MTILGTEWWKWPLALAGAVAQQALGGLGVPTEEPPWTTTRIQANAYLTEYYTQGMTGAGALTALKDAGLGYRKQDFYNDWRTMVGYEKGKSAVMGLVDSDYVPEGLQSVGPPGQQSAFSYRFSTPSGDPELGNYSITYTSVNSDRMLTVGQATAEAQAALEANPDRYARVIGQATLVGVKVR